LRCVFQRLEGEATREGLWLSSTVSNSLNDRFRVTATAVGRLDGAFGVPALAGLGSESSQHTGGAGAGPAKAGTPNQPLPRTGTVAIEGQTARFTRPRLVEEYSVSMDGVRQDFVVLERPPGAGELAVRLAVSGAKVEPAAGGAQLVLEHSGRKIAYSRLRATDATGKELTTRMDVIPAKAGTSNGALAVVVNDAEAVYPVRIDPTFSDANWISMGGIPGADSTVRAALVDGAGNLYIGGDFTIVGDVFAKGIAKWDGSSWAALGSGMAGGDGNSPPTVYALTLSGNDVYAGGNFTTAGGSAAYYIAKWNGSSWTALGSGMNDWVYALTVSGSDVYAGGGFTTAGGSTANYIAKWNGTSWTALGSGMRDDTSIYPSVNALAVSGSDVYAGGGFTTAGGSPANYIAKWNGSSWTPLGSGMDGPVLALAVTGSDLYAGGWFGTAGGSTANGIAKWNGSGWTALGSGMGMDGDYPYVSALAVSGGELFAGGYFTMAGGSAANYIAKWDGSSWTSLGSGITGPPGDPYYGGYVNALVVSGGELYAGGAFTTAGGNAANNIAKWDASSWTALGSGLGGGSYPYVSALARSGSDVYAGGDFTTAGGSPATNIAKWNGSSWTALGSGMGGGDIYGSGVQALAVSGSNVYAGGFFTTAGGSPATNIAKWNGSSWTALGSGMNSTVAALAVSGSDVYAGGHFTTAGGSAANYIAKWDGSTWSALGSGMGGGGLGTYVYALAVSGSNVYAGGYFTTAGGSAAIGIAKWNGSNWAALGSGISGVYALAVSGSDLYAGGYFTTAGGSAANYLAKWNGSSWSALGSGLNGDALALAVSGSDLYAGGDFKTAGGKVSAYIARAHLPTLSLPALSVLLSGTNVMVSWPSADTAGFALEQAGALAPSTSWVTNTTSATDDGTNKSVTLPATNSPQFFRLRSP
jgi:hypothetical protein